MSHIEIKTYYALLYNDVCWKSNYNKQAHMYWISLQDCDEDELLHYHVW